VLELLQPDLVEVAVHINVQSKEMKLLVSRNKQPRSDDKCQ
jgi:hypothetical protein